MTIVNQQNEVEGMVTRAIAKYRLGLDIKYHFNFGWGPTPPELQAQQGPYMLAYWVLLATPNPLLGQPPLGAFAAIPNPFPTEKEIGEFVLKQMENLRSAKAMALSTQNGKQHG